jgi:hypothetical protein
LEWFYCAVFKLHLSCRKYQRNMFLFHGCHIDIPCVQASKAARTHTQTCADLRLMEMCMLFPKIPGGPLVCSHFFGLSRLSP